MESVWRPALRTPRMDAVPGRGICRHFINGFCRFGSRCAYRHDCPVVPQSQICRYFQKSGCWYGDHCRYLHVRQLEVDAAVAGRRGSMPTVSSRVANGPTGRRGSEPALLQAELLSRPECNGSQVAVNVSNPQHGLRLLTADIAEEQSQDTDTPIAASWESLHSSEVAQAFDGRNEQETSNETMEDGAAAAASTSQRNLEETEAFLHSKDVICGICFDKVYDNADPKKHVFGILPNCNHAFCLQCIMTWRKTKDHGPESVKRCPHCRVRSAFYMPSEQWVEGQAKESVIAAFKEKFRKPLVCLFPALFKHNLLCFIYLVHSALPRTAVLRLLKCFRQDPQPSPWVMALVRQLERPVGTRDDIPLYTPLCSQRLKELSKHLVGSGKTGEWAMCFCGPAMDSDSQHASGLSELGTQQKRKGSIVTLDLDCEELEPQSKRMKMDACCSERCDVEDRKGKEEMESEAPAETIGEKLQATPEGPCEVLSEHIKASILQIKELLESQTEWDQSSMNVFKVLNDCNHGQVKWICSKLCLPDLPEQTLPNLCSSILSSALDFSYSTAATLIKSLLLQKVLSLSEPASRCLVTAVTSLCSRYPRPMCYALIGPVLEEKSMGSSQADLLNRLIEGCLDSHYRLLVLRMTLKISWTEAVLSVIHSLLDSEPDFSEELFTQFSDQLLSQGPQFTKSVKFAKIMLTVLTKYNNHMTAAHKHSLQGCLMENETFLKKSLQAALKRITS